MAKNWHMWCLLLASGILTVWPHPQPLTAYYPRFLFVSLLVCSLFWANFSWVRIAALSGLLIDFLIMAPLGWHLLLYVLPLWCVGRWRRNFNVNNLLQLFCFLIAALMLDAVFGQAVSFCFALKSSMHSLWFSMPASLLWGGLLWLGLNKEHSASRSGVHIR